MSSPISSSCAVCRATSAPTTDPSSWPRRSRHGSRRSVPRPPTSPRVAPPGPPTWPWSLRDRIDSAAVDGRTASSRASMPGFGTVGSAAANLDGEIFYSLREAQVVIESWRHHYNQVRPHASLGYRVPAPEVVVPAPATHMAGSPRPASPTNRPWPHDQCCTKARFSERAAAVSDDEDAGSGQEGQDHATQPVLAPVQSLVGQQPGATVLDDAADRAEPRAVRCTYPTNVGLDAVLAAERAIVGAVVAGIGVQPRDGGADDLSHAQKMREEPRVVDVGGRGDDSQREAVGCDHQMVLGPSLAPVGEVGTGQLAAALGPDRTAVDDHVP